jgi:hypothetical protein
LPAITRENPLWLAKLLNIKGRCLAERVDSDSSTFRICKLQKPHCRRCHECRLCRRALPAIAR